MCTNRALTDLYAFSARFIQLLNRKLAYVCIADYYKSTTSDYIVHCQVKEGRSTLIEINVSVPTKEEASSMCAKWKDASQEIYAFIMKSLMK